jgi:hypothetical protein
MRTGGKITPSRRKHWLNLIGADQGRAARRPDTTDMNLLERILKSCSVNAQGGRKTLAPLHLASAYGAVQKIGYLGVDAATGHVAVLGHGHL